jgi:hypothetical protein
MGVRLLQLKSLRKLLSYLFMEIAILVLEEVLKMVMWHGKQASEH